MLPFGARDRPHVQTAGAEVWSRDLKELRRAGFDAVDLTDSWVRPADLSTSGLRILADAIVDAGLQAPAISAIRRSVIDPEVGVANLDYSHRTIEAAARLGCSVVSVGLHRPLSMRQHDELWFWTVPGPADKPDRDTFDLAVRRLRDLGEHGSSVGVSLSLELYEDTLLGTAQSAVDLLDAIDHDNVGLNPDLGNLVRQQAPIEPLERMLELCLPRTNYWHTKNYVRMEHLSGVVMTSPSSMESGVIDYRTAVRRALELGYRGAFCVEHYGGDMLGMMTTNRTYLASLLPRVPEP